MNTAAFANFIRHLLFLFLILNLAAGIVLYVESEDCLHDYETRDFFPITIESEVKSSLYFFVDFLFTLISGLAYLVIIMSAVGIYGATYLHRHQLVNFAAGLSFLFMAPCKLLATYVLNNLIYSFDQIVRAEYGGLFTSSYHFLEQHKGLGGPAYNKLFENDHYDNVTGWSNVVSGDNLTHMYINYAQIRMECCGRRGRSDWEVPIPRSCCSEDYLFGNCTLDVAYSKPCNREYGYFRSSMQTLLIQTVFFAFLEVAAGACALYLAHLEVKYPDGDYKSDDSSSEVDDRDDIF